MGKSHRNVYAGSNSKSYQSPHERGFAKRKKAYTRKQIRTHNKNSDELSVKTCHYDILGNSKMNTHWSSAYVENDPNNKWNISTIYEKQIKRRGKKSLFYGHRQYIVEDMYY